MGASSSRFSFHFRQAKGGCRGEFCVSICAAARIPESVKGMLVSVGGGGKERKLPGAFSFSDVFQ